MTGTVLLCIHLGVLVLLYALRKAGILKVGSASLFAAAFLPVFGELAILSLYVEDRRGQMASKSGDLEAMNRRQVRQSIYYQKEDDDRTAIPLEDALIIDDASTKRSVMMDILMDDSHAYMSSMREAQHSDDTEVVHYATTALTTMSEEADAELKKASRHYAESHASDEALNAYIDVLRAYLDEQISGGELLEIHRKEYQNLLKIRIGRTHDRDDLAYLADSYLDTGNYKAADGVISALEKQWRKTTRTLRLRLRYDYMQGKGEEIQELLQKVQQDGLYPSDVREILDFWEDKRENA